MLYQHVIIKFLSVDFIFHFSFNLLSQLFMSMTV